VFFICAKILHGVDYFLMSFLKTSWLTVIDLIFPAFCLVCEIEGTYLCRECSHKMPRLEKQKCLMCQKPSAFGRTHPDCGQNKINGIISVLDYHNPQVKNIIETFKYKFVSSLSYQLSVLLMDEINNHALLEYFKEFTVIPVPLHRQRLRWRGFNQSQLLAQELSTILNAPYDDGIIKRIKNTKPQVRLSKEQRKENISKAFMVLKPPPLKCLIVDDVVTTGSTLNEICKILKRSGCKEVWACTLAAD
jgi:competence protein ComFC